MHGVGHRPGSLSSVGITENVVYFGGAEGTAAGLKRIWLRGAGTWPNCPLTHRHSPVLAIRPNPLPRDIVWWLSNGRAISAARVVPRNRSLLVVVLGAIHPHRCPLPLLVAEKLPVACLSLDLIHPLNARLVHDGLMLALHHLHLCREGRMRQVQARRLGMRECLYGSTD